MPGFARHVVIAPGRAGQSCKLSGYGRNESNKSVRSSSPGQRVVRQVRWASPMPGRIRESPLVRDHVTRGFPCRVLGVTLARGRTRLLRGEDGR
jgi:hypothetical protein